MNFGVLKRLKRMGGGGGCCIDFVTKCDEAKVPSSKIIYYSQYSSRQY